MPACSPLNPLNAERQAGKLWILFFKVFWIDSRRGMNPRSINFDADALTTHYQVAHEIAVVLSEYKNNSQETSEHFILKRFTLY